MAMVHLRGEKSCVWHERMRPSKRDYERLPEELNT